MKKILLYIIVLIFAGIINNAFIYGQFRLDQLTGKIWLDHDYDEDYYVKYTYDCCIEKSIFGDSKGENPTLEEPFYLSDTPDTQFNESKVNSPSGSYMILKGGAPDRDVCVYKILKLDNEELILEFLYNGTVLTHKALNTYTMKYVLDKTPTHTLAGAPGPLQGVFSINRNTDFIASYDLPVNTDQIPDKLYEDVHLTKSKNIATQKRGKFLRKFALTSGYYLVAVRFGSGDNTTVVLCIVDGSGNVKSTLEGLVIANGIMVKSCSITPGQIMISQAKPTVTTLSFDFPPDISFPGNVITTFYNFSNSGFTKSFENIGPKTFTKILLSDQSKNSVAEY